jgi:hypothetical protein
MTSRFHGGDCAERPSWAGVNGQGHMYEYLRDCRRTSSASDLQPAAARPATASLII